MTTINSFSSETTTTTTTSKGPSPYRDLAAQRERGAQYAGAYDVHAAHYISVEEAE